MKALFVTMQDQASRRWAPVARLTHEDGQYRFVYTEGSRHLCGFEPFGRMRDLGSEYISEDLFPLFANRVLPKVRPEYHRYLNWLDLPEAGHDALEELGRTGGLRATDGIELIHCPEPTQDRRYELHFFARGLRHLAPENQHHVDRLHVGEQLYLLRDMQNAFDRMALLLRTDDPVTLVGYVPRYYSADICQVLDLIKPSAVTVLIQSANQDAPTEYRLLCKLDAPWPKGFSPCEQPEFQPLRTRSKRATHAEEAKHSSLKRSGMIEKRIGERLVSR